MWANASEADTVCLECGMTPQRDKKIPTDEAVLASRYDSPLGRKVTERVLTDTLYSTAFLPSIGRGGSERLYDLVDNICPEAGDIVRKAGRDVGLDLG